MSANTCAKPFVFARYSSVGKFDLVFEGGGAKGTVFVGALQEFEKRKYAGRRFVGTSAGAITATLLAAGYTADEMLRAVNEKTSEGKPRFTTFMDAPGPGAFSKSDIEGSVTYDIFRSVDMPLLPDRAEKKLDEHIITRLMESQRYRHLFSFVERGGLYEGNKFVEWLREKLDADCRKLGTATLKEFYERTGNELTVVASDTTSHDKLVMNRLTAPDVPVIWAVRMSMSIPFVWQEVRWQKDWGNYLGNDISNHTIVDGGVLSNFPLNLVADSDAEVISVMGPAGTDNVPRLGLLIDETLSVPGADKLPKQNGNNELIASLESLRTVQRVMRLIDTMTDANDRLVMRVHGNKVCRLPAKGYGTTEFDMSDQKVDLLVKAGREAMKECLDNNGW